MECRHIDAYNAGMKRIQYTIRAVPTSVDRALRQRAKREHKSLNTVLLEALVHATQNGTPQKKHQDLAPLFGTWVEDPEFDAAIAGFRKVEPEKWK